MNTYGQASPAAPTPVVFARGQKRTAILAMRHYETEQWWDAAAAVVQDLIEDGYSFHTEGVRSDGPSPMMDTAKAMGRVLERGGLAFQGDRLAEVLQGRATTHDLTTSQVNAATTVPGRLFARGMAVALRAWEPRMSDSTAAYLAEEVVARSRQDSQSRGVALLMGADRADRQRELHAVAAREADASLKVCLLWGAGHLPGLSEALRGHGWHEHIEESRQVPRGRNTNDD